MKERANAVIWPSMLLVAIPALCWWQPLSDDVLYELKGDGWLEQCELVPAGDLSGSSLGPLRRRAEKFILQQSHQDLTISKLLMVADEDATAHIRYGKGEFHYRYRQWAARVKDWRRNLPPMAMMIYIDRKAAVSLRGADGRLQRAIIHGANPLSIPIGKTELRILDVVFFPFGKPVRPRIYLVTEAELSASLGRQVVRWFQELGLKHFEVAIRNDAWFISDELFPIAPVFWPAGEVPSFEAYGRTHTVFCVFNANADVDACLVHKQSSFLRY